MGDSKLYVTGSAMGAPTSGKRMGRRQLRGKPLLGSCQRAHISHN
jgi:hypothetical protein